MSNLLLSNIPKAEAREKIMLFEEKLGQLPDARFGDNAAPLKHTFADGMYIREIFMPKGMLLTSKIHKKLHPYFVLQGDVSVMTDDGIIRIKAPYWGMTTPGTKRILYIHEDTVWVTVHATKSKNLKTIEKKIIAKTFEEVPQINKEEYLRIKEAV